MIQPGALFAVMVAACIGAYAPARADVETRAEVPNIVGDAAFGEYLSGECTTCHQVSGASGGIASIIQWPEEDFVLAMRAYRGGDRLHPIMEMIAGRLSDQEIAALAAYFGGLE